MPRSPGGRHRPGWSAAAAVLILVTLSALLGGSSAGGPRLASADPSRPEIVPLASPTPAPAPTPSLSGRSAATARPPARAPARKSPAAKRPARVVIAAKGSGRFRTADLAAPASGRQGQLLRYQVQVEAGLPFDPRTTAAEVDRVLRDRRSWTGSGQWRMQLVRPGQRADFSVLITTPQTTDRLCAPLLTRGTVSCQRGDRAILNARRWAYGVRYYGQDVAAYRVYLVNHEVGHVLGYGHRSCPRKGQVAPVMLQQTKGLQGCRANPWPSPGRR
jgi:hypothetical protein